MEQKPFATPFHDDLIELLRTYYFIGGMPEAVAVYAESKNPGQVRVVHNDILASYELDFAKHASPADISRLSRIWQSIPRHLAKENRRFLFSAVHPSARSREYERALQWLKDAALIHFCHAIEKVELPLIGFTIPGAFFCPGT
ncbi:MAG: hypothetical protein GF398_14155 [Chitinivibrionales bacterium]|nr:hypothetical protein [Chitinivibrionales bacterium]